MTGTGSERRFEGWRWWSGGTPVVRPVPVEGGPPPESDAPRRRLPAWLLLPLAPVLGGAFLVALPVVGTVLVMRAVVRAALAGGGRAAGDLAAAVAAPAARPGEAHLAGGQAAPEDLPPDEAAPNQGLDEVDAEVRSRRTPPEPHSA